MMQEQLAAQQQRHDSRVQEANRATWANTVFHEEIFNFPNAAIDSVYFDGGDVIIKSGGNTAINDPIRLLLEVPEPKAIIIQDQNGDQWVVEKKDGKYKSTKVPGGGLSPNMNATVTDAAFDIVKQSLRALRQEYTDNKIEQTRQTLSSKRSELDRVIAQGNSQYQPANTSGAASSQVQSVLFDFEEEAVTQTPSETNFDRVSKETKQLELEVNRITLISVIADNLDSREDYKLVARDLKIGDQNLSPYVTQQRAANATDEQIIAAVKTAIIQLIDQVFIQYSNSN
jgi:hypothetical protein